jgi:hypothetical protein
MHPQLKAAIAVMVAVLAGALSAVLSSTSGSWIDVTTVDQVERASVIYAAPLRIFVVDSSSGPLALSAISPHRPDLGERVLYCESADAFIGWHGEWFDHIGKYVTGPASRGLDRVGIRIDGDTVQVEPGALIKGPSRQFSGQLRSGPLCPPWHPREIKPGFAAPRPA